MLFEHNMPIFLQSHLMSLLFYAFKKIELHKTRVNYNKHIPYINYISDLCLTVNANDSSHFKSK